MSTVRYGHPISGFILGILGIAVAFLLTILFGAIAGAVAGILGLSALALGVSASKGGKHGAFAILTGVLAIVLAVTMTGVSVNMMNQLKDTAAKSGVAPTIARYADNPYLGLSSIAVNAVNAGSSPEVYNTIQQELDALNRYTGNTETTAVKNAPNAG